MDLRDLESFQESLKNAGFQASIPTYVLAECVLVYMEPHESSALLKHLGQQLPSAVCVVYEQVRFTGCMLLLLCLATALYTDCYDHTQL